MLYRRKLIQREKDQLVSETLIEEKKEDENQDEQTSDDLSDNSVVTIPSITFGNYLWSNPLSVVGFNGYYDSYGNYHYLELYDTEHSIFYYNEDTKRIVNTSPGDTEDNILVVQQDQDNSLLGSLNLRNAVSIKEDCFYNCKKLNNIKFESTIDNISDNAFRMCKELTCIDLRGCNPGIEENSFYGCDKLTVLVDGEFSERLKREYLSDKNYNCIFKIEDEQLLDFSGLTYK